MVQAYQEGKFLAEPEQRGKPRPNPMSDPAAMEGMMGMMKGNMAMMVPQTLIMGWINAFFSGFVISKSAIYFIQTATGAWQALLRGTNASASMNKFWTRFTLPKSNPHRERVLYPALRVQQHGGAKWSDATRDQRL